MGRGVPLPTREGAWGGGLLLFNSLINRYDDVAANLRLVICMQPTSLCLSVGGLMNYMYFSRYRPYLTQDAQLSQRDRCRVR